MKATERLYLTADRKTVVKADDSRAVHIFAAKGQHINDEVARRYGLFDKEEKQAKKAANKMVRSSKNKMSEGD